jgi:hypothetical protein
VASRPPPAAEATAAPLDWLAPLSLSNTKHSTFGRIRFEPPSGGTSFAPSLGQPGESMSKEKNNVNPNFYKDGGRERTGGMDTGDAGTPQKSEVRHDRETKMPGKRGQPIFIPGGAPVGEPGKSARQSNESKESKTKK